MNIAHFLLKIREEKEKRNKKYIQIEHLLLLFLK